MKLTLRIWLQDSAEARGSYATHELVDVSPDASLLEALDQVNERRVLAGDRAIEFDHDCREGICGACGFLVDGVPHGPLPRTTTCQLHLRSFRDGATLTLEPFRSGSFPVIRDLKVDRLALERIAQAGAYVSSSIRTAPEANSMLVPRADAEASFAAASCIGCGACVASCKNAAASLFTAARVEHLARLPQGRPEAKRRVVNLVAAMDAEGFGSCSNTEACEAACPQGISTDLIASLNRSYLWARLSGH